MPTHEFKRVAVNRPLRSAAAAVTAILAITLPSGDLHGQKPATVKNSPAELPDRVANAKGPGEIQRFADHGAGVNCVAVSQDGRQLASASDDKTVFVYDLRTLKVLHRLEDNDAPIGGVAFTPNGEDIVTASGRGEAEDRNIRLWDRPTGQLRMRVIGRNFQTTSLAVAPDGLSLMTTYKDRFSDLRFMDAPGDTLALVTHKERCWDCAYSPDSKFVVTVGGNGETFVWSTARPPRPASRMLTHEADVRAVAFSPSGEFVITGSSDRTLRLWKNWVLEDDWQMVREFKGHTDEVNDVAFSPDGKTIASAGRDKSIRVWDVATAKSLHVFSGHNGPVTTVTYLPSGKFLASASADKTVRLWSLVAAAAKPSTPDFVLIDPAKKGGPGVRVRPEKKASLAVPEAAAVAEAEKLIRQLFKDELASAKSAADKKKLARKIIELGGQADYSADERYAMLQTAQTVAVDAGSSVIAVEAADAIEAWFKIDAIKSLAVLFERLSPQARTTETRTELVEVALPVIEQALAARRYAEAETIVRASGGTISKPDLARRVRLLEARIRDERSKWDGYQAALKQLKTTPGDAKANQVAGMHLLLVERDWAKGLAHLAKGTDEKLKAVAAKDLVNPETNDKQVELGDQWLAIAEAASGDEKQVFLAAADYWYRKALADATGLRKLKIQKSLEKVGQIADNIRRQ